jgi:hypothetical protein
MNAKRYGDARLVVALLTLAAVVLSSTGCGIVRPVRGRRGEAVHAGFLGDYSQLEKKEGYAAQEVYINPKAAWSKYDAIYIDSVSMWITGEAKKPSPDDQQKITDMLYKALHEKLGEKFKVAQRPGVGVIKLRAAFTEAKGAIVPEVLGIGERGKHPIESADHPFEIDDGDQSVANGQLDLVPV